MYIRSCVFQIILGRYIYSFNFVIIFDDFFCYINMSLDSQMKVNVLVKKVTHKFSSFLRQENIV